MKLCSACLLGIACRYDGLSKPNERILKLAQTEILIPICPEQLGGQSTPRPDSQTVFGSGYDVLDGRAKVLEKNGNDVTSFFIRGAQRSLRIAQLYDIHEAILKQKSPSCGCGKIYDGLFSGRIISGDGVTTALLKKNNLVVISEEELHF